MKTRRSGRLENNLQSILFPNKKFENSVIVPESPLPTCMSSTVVSHTIASVLETPDDIPVRNDYQNRAETKTSEQTFADDTNVAIIETPVHNLGKRKGVTSILELDFENKNPVSATTCSEVNLCKRNRRSYAETPDDIAVRNDYQNRAGTKSSEQTFADDTDVGIIETPIFNLGKRKGVTSILELDFENQNSVSATTCNEVNLCKRNRRRSYAETILPFDLNDKETVARKLAHIKKSTNKRKSLQHYSSSNSNISSLVNSKQKPSRRKSLFLEINDKINTSFVSTISDTSANKENENSHSVNQDITTVSFENSNLDLTDANCNNEILVHSQARTSGLIDSHEQINSTEVPNLSLRNFNISHENHVRVDHNNKGIPCAKYKKILEGEFSPINRSLFQNDEAFSPTQPASILILQGVISIVDVRSGAENRSLAFKELMMSLGAVVLDKFTKQATHVVFREGSRTTYNKAIQRKLYLVSPLWVEACRVKSVRVSESLFPISNEYTKSTVLGNGKVTVPRKQKSIQPRSFDEAMKAAEIKLQRKMKRTKTNDSESPAMLFTPTRIQAHSEDVNSPLYRLANLQKPIIRKRQSLSSVSGGESSAEEEDCSTPLAMRMYNRLMATKPDACSSSPGIESKINDKPHTAGDSITSQSPNEKSSFSEKRNELEISFGSESKTFPSEKEIKDTNNFNNISESLGNLRKDFDITDKSHKNNFSDIVRRRSTRLAAVNVTQNDDNSNNNKVIELKKHIAKNTKFKSSSLPSCSIDKSSSIIKRRRLHTVDFAPSQDLLIPCTPPTPLRSKDTVYDTLTQKHNVSQRKEILRLKGKPMEELSVFPLPRSSKRQVNTGTSERNNKSNSQTSSRLSPVQENLETPKGAGKEGRFSLVPRKRNSLEEFVPRFGSRKRISHRKGNLQLSLPSICITSCHSNVIESLYAIIKSLGGFITTSDVDSNTTHVVCGSERRTLNVLLGISQGCWILDASWLYESVELLRWAPEEPFELFNFCPGAKISRTSRENKSEIFKSTLLQKLGRIYVPDTCDPAACVIQDLLLNCGASICSTLRSADLIITNKELDSAVKQVSPQWLFDSIQHWEVKDIEAYSL